MGRGTTSPGGKRADMREPWQRFLGSRKNPTNDPPGYQSREALKIKMARPTIGTGTIGHRLSYRELQDAYNMIIGSPETVIKKLRHVKAELNPGYILIYGNEGAMAHEAVMRSIELLGTKVIPALKDD